MCGRYTLTKPIKTIETHFSPITFHITHKQRYNIAPAQEAPVVISKSGFRELHSMRWGLIPHWVREPRTNSALINARSETVHQKPSFRDAFRSHRCLVPADGFIEWKTEKKEKKPHHIFLRDKELFAFAGIWSEWDGPDGSLRTYSILTTEANSRLRSLHARMPVILSPHHYNTWLECEADPGELRNLLKPFPSDSIFEHEISREINSARNDNPNCLRPVPEE